MLIDNQKIEITWNNANKKHYISKGYNFTKNGDKFVINVKDLSKGSNHKVEVICDNCGTVKTMNYSDYIKCHNKHNIDLCSRCRNLSAKMTWEEKYGVSHPRQLQEIKDKGVATCIERYGCANPMQNPHIRQKAENTLVERYGVKHPLQSAELYKKAENACIQKYGVSCAFQSNEIKAKIKETNLNKYGVENPQQYEAIKQKTIETNIEKYGVPNPMQNKEILEKAIQTFYKNGSCPTSSQQIKVKNMLLDIYGNCELNYPCSYYSLDCVVNIDGIIIDVEYDGQFWHKNQEKDEKRDKVVLSKGYKILRIKGNYAVPTKEQLKESVDYLINNDEKYNIIELDI